MIPICAYIQNSANLYAAEFAKLTGQSWTVSGQTDMDGDISRSYTLTQADGLAVQIYGARSDDKVTCFIVLPKMPDGTKYGKHTIWRDWYFNNKMEEPRASVGWDRYGNNVKACAKRFVSHVVVPFATVQGHIAERIAQAAKSYSDADNVAETLARNLGGSVHTDNNGRQRLRLPSELPGATIQPGGSVRLDYTPTMSAFVFEKYCLAILEEQAMNRAKKEQG